MRSRAAHNARLGVSASFLILISACGAAPSNTETATVDTLPNGQIVVDNGTAEGTSEAVQLERIVQIGDPEGGPAAFGRVADVSVGPEGDIYILDAQAAEVRVFNEVGEYQRSIGRQGTGPGELQLPYAIAFDWDSRLWVADERAIRYHVFDQSGTFMSSYRRPIRRLLRPGELRFSDDGALLEQGFLDGSRSIVRFAVADSVVPMDTIALPRYQPPAFTRELGAEQLIRVIPFAPRRAEALGQDGDVWIGVGSAYELVQLGIGGDTLRIVRRTTIRTPLTSREREAAGLQAEEARQEGYEVDRSRIPEMHPYFTAITVATNGYLWVRRTAGSRLHPSGSASGVVVKGP